MRSSFSMIAFGTVLLCSLNSAPVLAKDPAALLASRPCGPDSMTGPLRYLIPQGFFGANFRPACESHDKCYGTLNSQRSQCDDCFRQNMINSCEDSRFPRLCRVVAKGMAGGVIRFGSGAFESAQNRARLRR